MSARRHREKSIAEISTDNGTVDDNVGVYVRGYMINFRIRESQLGPAYTSPRVRRRYA